MLKKTVLKEVSDHSGYMGNMDRVQAEHHLMKEPVGTYLLRNTDDGLIFEMDRLEKENYKHVQSCIISFLPKEGKVSEHLLIHLEKGWRVYSDNSNLSEHGKVYPSLPSLILSLKNEGIKFPLKKR